MKARGIIVKLSAPKQKTKQKTSPSFKGCFDGVLGRMIIALIGAIGCAVGYDFAPKDTLLQIMLGAVSVIFFGVLVAIAFRVSNGFRTESKLETNKEEKEK